MSRIAKADVNAVLANAARQLLAAGGSDGRVSRSEADKLVKSLQGDEKKLVSTFFKFVDHRDFKAGATVTKKDLDKALTYAREHMVAKYDLNKNGLSSAEVKKMSLTGKLAVDLAKSLKETAGNIPLEQGETFYEFVERLTTTSRTDFTADSRPQPDALTTKQIIAATHQSTYTHVKTLADAYEAVDQGEFVVRNLKDAAGNKYTAIDYGAGDNTYGAIFKEGSAKPAVGVQDGDLYPL